MKTQFHIRLASGIDDQILVKQILLSAAEKFGVADNTVTSREPETICCLTERPGYGFGLGARVVGEMVIVDFNPHGETSPLFCAVEDFIKTESIRVFGERVYFPTSSEYISLRNSR
jgi:hypothetical protein